MSNTLTELSRSVQEVARAELISRFSSDEVLSNLVHKAVRAAVLEHKRASNPVAGWKNGQIVIIQPEDIVVSER